ncbi:C4-dicarboxylate ABC transporter [Sulfitobacter sp. SK012]|uniref:sensor histidine kinase n=1 Tax=Sulfitobacter sp. SK012 TaxID=1389005 RepID=UPI000E0ACBD7|nr:ATP-binding protein [Sulfitobacter sp. SK012]AXI48906.1 C4-dicarboxylate ABC transporter [Sulfitobacter sp. SK012]
MKNAAISRAVVVLVFLGAVAAGSLGVWRYGTDQAMGQLAARGQADLALASDRLVGQLQRYRDLAVLMAGHPQVDEMLRRDPQPADIALLQEVADKSAALDVQVLDRDGKLRAAANWALASRTEVDFISKPYIRRALQGALGWGHGPRNAQTPRVFFHASPIFDDAAQVNGVLVVSTDLNGIDYSWRGANPAVFFTDPQGVVQISNRSELVFWRRPPGEPGLQPAQGKAPPFSSSMEGTLEIWQLGWGPYLPREALHLTQALPVIGMTGEVLLDVAPARRLAASQAAAVAALCLAFGALLFLATERRRTLARANAQLEERVASRTAALAEINTALHHEAAVREEAQAALRRAQDELVQASKLSALGQMSAGISHELNQPLMAIRSFSENAVQFLERDNPARAAENLTRISDMARRMARIIKNLRAFSRQENTPQGHVDLGAALDAAFDLTRSHIEEAGVTLQYDPAPGPIWVRGGEVRLSQVFVNLITNAVDAMATSEIKVLRVQVSQGKMLTVNFQDTGPGVEMPDKIFDPFYTTKTDGETGGMGLGLSISYGIVQSFGGQIKGTNCEGGGALFSVTLERELEQEDAA